ncbi:MAG TPA: SxtJ family membrane protein [Thermoanaerobaculia bacterium]|nr:SxtJ family membrane protein [Thermoanaerobaculia bacterium]
MSSTSTELSRRTITSFALIVSGALLAIAAYQRWRGAQPWVVIALVSIAAVLSLLSAVAPRSLHPVYRGWMRVGEVLGWINTRIILTLVFFLVVTPIGLLMRLFGRSPIATVKRDSYWTDVEPHSYGDRHVEKQF